MLLTLLILFIVANAIAASVLGLTASDEAKGFKRSVLLCLAGLLVANLAAFLIIYATTYSYGFSH